MRQNAKNSLSVRTRSRIQDREDPKRRIVSATVDLVICNLRKRMARDGWNVESLADSAGVARPFLSDFLNRKKPKASVEYVSRIAKAVGCDLRDLLTPPA